MKAICFVLFACLFAFASLAQAQRAEKNADAAVIATVKTGEPFTFESENDADWCKVTLASGNSGWMQLNSIRLYFTEKDLPTREKDPAGESEIEQFASGRGLKYAAVTRRAARGDGKALKQFFSLAQDADGAAAESIGGVPTVVYHILGDESSRNSCSLSHCPIG